MKFRILFLFLGIFLVHHQGFGFADTLHVKSTTKSYKLNKHFHYYIDESGTQPFERIKQFESGRFKPLHGEDLRRGLSEAHTWVALTLQSDISIPEDFIIDFKDPSIYFIRLYETRGETIVTSTTGTSLPQAEKDVPGNKNNFEITLKPQETVTLYFEIYSKSSVTISAILQPASTTFSRYLNERVLFGVFYGLCILLVLYSVLLFLTTKSNVFLIYGGYVFSVACFTAEADGFLPMYFHGVVSTLNGYDDIFFFTLTNLLALAFMTRFLRVSTWSKRLSRYITGYSILFVILVAGSFIISKSLMLAVVELLGLGTLAVFIAVGVLAVKRGTAQAKYYLISYLAFGVFIVIFILSQFRVIAFSGLVQYSIHIGYAVSMIILSYGLSQRINSIYKALLSKEKEKKEIIEQKNKELEVKVAERTADIAKKEVNLRSILDNNDNAIWLIDHNYQLIDFNTYFSHYWLQNYGSVLSRGGQILELVPTEELREKWKKRYDQGLAGNSDTYIDSYLIDDVKHDFEIKAFPIQVKNKIKGVAFFSKDITQRRKAEKQLKAQNKMLIKVNKELDSFVYSASHDLKAPLASVLGLINLVRTENDLETRLQYYEMMEKSVVRLDQFIKDIIDYSRNERTAMKYTEIDLTEMVDSIFADLKYLNGTSEIKKNINILAKAPFVSDPTRLKIAVRNLVSNAIRYGCAGHVPKKQIDLLAEVDQQRLTIEVQDYGPGISKEHQKHIFDMFYRAHEQSSGTGLGLYIVKETVEKLKGKVAIKSESGNGSTFILEIPNWR